MLFVMSCHCYKMILTVLYLLSVGSDLVPSTAYLFVPSIPSPGHWVTSLLHQVRSLTSLFAVLQFTAIAYRSS